MGKAIAIVLVLVAGGGLAAQNLALSSKLDDQASELKRLRERVVALDETVANVASVDPAAAAARSFETPAGSGALAADIAVDDAELRALVEKMVKDEGVLGELASRVTPRMESADALVNSDAFRDGVQRTIDAIEEEERQQRAERRQEQTIARAETRAREIAERLQLNNAASLELSNILVESAQAMTDVFGLVRSGEIDRREVRDVMREQREETNALVAQILTPTQYEQYEQMQQEDRGGFGGFGAPGGGRRGRGGGDTGNDATPTPATSNTGGAPTQGAGGF